MNTSFRILCLSHDPAIILDPDWNNPEQPANIAGDPRMMGEIAELAPHSGCDLLVGAFAYCLTALICPVRTYPGHPPVHRQPEWLSIEWLRLLDAAHQMDLPDAGLSTALKHLPACWSPTRIHRLRELLLPAPVAEPVLAGATA